MPRRGEPTMPIFEYLCLTCNRIYSFLSLAASAKRTPVCPRCGGTKLERVPSSFALSRARTSAAKAPPGTAGPGDDAAMNRMEHEMMRMAANLGEKDAEDPRTIARMMRRLAEASGEPVTPSMQEMFQRMEAGEDPEALEEELGPQLEAELGEQDGPGPEAPTRDDGLYDL